MCLISSHFNHWKFINAPDNGKSVQAVFNGRYDDGAGTQNIQLSSVAFAAIEDNSSQTSLSPVTWAFN
jgi:hypothetical protein